LRVPCDRTRAQRKAFYGWHRRKPHVQAPGSRRRRTIQTH
jgi:hypothetical protein